MMAKLEEVHWLKNLDVEEVSVVDVPANRRPFRYFKREGTNVSKVRAHRMAKQIGDPDDLPGVAPSDGEAPGMEPVIEEGIHLYPWGQAVSDMAAAFSTDDAPRIAGLLLAKYVEVDRKSVV